MKQKFKHDPANGVWGDCHRTAIAYCLGLQHDDVPHIGDGGPSSIEFERRENEYLKTRGLVPIRVPFADGDIYGILNVGKVSSCGTYYLLGGMSRTGVNHTVVCLEDKIVCDPSLTDAGIIGPCDDGYYWLTFFGSIQACPKESNSV